MDILTYIQSQIKTRLTNTKFVSPELDTVASELVPAVLTTLFEDHETILSSLKDTLNEKSDAELFENPQIKQIIALSVEKVCALYITEYTNNSLTTKAHEVVSNDIATLLKSAPLAWDTLKQKTHQELMNDVTPGSNEERVYLWLEEIKKNTGIAAEGGETVEEYSTRAITKFLRG